MEAKVEERHLSEGATECSEHPTTPLKNCSTVIDSDDELSERHTGTLRDLARKNQSVILRQGSKRDSFHTPPCREDSVVSFSLNKKTVNVRSPGDIRKDTGKWAGVEQKGQFLGQSVGEAGRFLPESPALGFTRIPSQAFSHVPDNPAVVEQATVKHEHSDADEDDGCPICLGDDEENEFITTNCSHKFHSTCILEYLRLRNRYQCPMCSTDIEHLNLPDGEVLTQAALKEKFYAPAWDLKFKQHPDYQLSFYSVTDEVKDLPLAVGQNEDRVWIQHCTFPAIVLQLVDSNGNDCHIDDDHDIDVIAQHLCPNAELFNCKVKAQNDGTAIFSNLVLHISKTEVIGCETVFPLRFQVRVSSELSHLPVHNKQVFAGVRFPDNLREGTLPKEQLAASNNTAAPPNSSPLDQAEKKPSASNFAKPPSMRKTREIHHEKRRNGKQAACCGAECVIS
eukprot:TRINITY_DN21281_c0_g1_i1.p1 TRINITY_DN21281_c0_g1~~TRINITY_DN21281_c0_g1_i1.p1  ORF type:complete len:452 (+),score=99.97 TRINITY_DN21281_c0_g1_i1:111-1466(+)